LLAEDPGQAEAIRRAATGARVVFHGRSDLRAFEGAGEHCIRFAPAVVAEGSAVRQIDPVAVVESWVQELRRPASEAAWLLAPVIGAAAVVRGETDRAEGLVPDGDGGLTVCSERPVPDWAQRMAHPALRLRTTRTPAGEAVAAGPFVAAGRSQRLVAAGGGAVLLPLLAGVELVQASETDPALLFRQGRVDVAIVGGREVARLLDGGLNDLRVERIARWDVVYALWFGARGRWVNDPHFRAWIATAIDRQAIVRYLFDDRGEPAYRLLGSGSAEWTEPPRRPFSAGSSPRLELLYDAADPRARSIASRLKAELEQAGIEIRLEATGGQALEVAANEDRFQMALLAHHPPLEDPVLALQQTLMPLGAALGPSSELLERAAWWEDERERRSAAVFAEDSLLRPARLVPLVRLQSWLATRPTLRGLEPQGWGELGLERAWWAR
jgi:hypothetical protein